MDQERRTTAQALDVLDAAGSHSGWVSTRGFLIFPLNWAPRQLWMRRRGHLQLRPVRGGFRVCRSCSTSGPHVGGQHDIDAVIFQEAGHSSVVATLGSLVVQ